MVAFVAAADNPSHRRVTSQAVGVVHVLVAIEAAEHRLTKQSGHHMLAVLAGARIDELVANHIRSGCRRPAGSVVLACCKATWGMWVNSVHRGDRCRRSGPRFSSCRVVALGHDWHVRVCLTRRRLPSLMCTKDFRAKRGHRTGTGRYVHSTGKGTQAS